MKKTKSTKKSMVVYPRRIPLTKEEVENIMFCLNKVGDHRLPAGSEPLFSLMKKFRSYCPDAKNLNITA